MQFFPSYLPIYSVVCSEPERLRHFNELIVNALAAQGLRPATVQAVIDTQVTNYKGAQHCHRQSCGDYPVYSLKGTRDELVYRLICLARSVDILLVENSMELGLPRIVLGGECTEQDVDALNLAAFDRDQRGAVQSILNGLERKLAARPVWACILMGGRSSRMGRPKHLLSDKAGSTWLERTVHTIHPHVAGIALSGQGEIPAGLSSLPRLADVPNVGGPLTGILSAMRWQPDVSWLFLACDMPRVTGEAVAWLLGERKIGQWGTVPTRGGMALVEPLFARYEPQCAALFERLCAAGVRRIRQIVDFEKIHVVQIPENLQESWQNINTPEELRRLLPSSSSTDA